MSVIIRNPTVNVHEATQGFLMRRQSQNKTERTILMSL